MPAITETEIHTALSALLAVIEATQDYLPPDGISKEECIDRILAATDNLAIAAILAKLDR